MNRLCKIQGVACLAARRSFQSVATRCFSSVAVSRGAQRTITRLTPTTTNNIQFVRHASQAGAPPTSGIVQFKLADVGEGIAECEILKWHIKEGDTVKEFDPLCEVQSDKATVEITSRYDGIVTKLHVKKDIDLGGSPSAAGASPVQHAEQAAGHGHAAAATQSTSHHDSHLSDKSKALATPAVRHLSKSRSIDLTQVQGTGRDGREDILAFEQNEKQPQAHATHKPTPTPHHETSVPQSHTTTHTAGSQKQREQKQSLSGIKRVMARTMTAAAQVPHFGYCDEITMDALQVLRSQFKPLAESKGIKITYMPFFIKAASLALSRYPILNSSINADMTEVTIKNYHNIGVAMDTPQGLVVPNIKDVQDKSLFEIAKELQRLQTAALNNQLSPSDMSGGTFTLSNIGTIGGTYASPVLVIPEVAIGAIGKMQKVPRFDSKGAVIPVHILQVSWSADHRVIDGATMAHFSNLMKLYLEKPETMLTELR